MATIAQDLTALMRMPWFAGVVLPGVLAVVVAVWKAASRPSGWQPEDAGIGFDLMFAAYGSQLALLPTIGQDPVALQVADRLLILLPGTLFFSALGMWAVGYSRTAQGTWEPRGWALGLLDGVGFVLLAGVFASSLVPAGVNSVLDVIFR